MTAILDYNTLDLIAQSLQSGHYRRKYLFTLHLRWSYRYHSDLESDFFVGIDHLDVDYSEKGFRLNWLYLYSIMNYSIHHTPYLRRRY